MNSYSVIFHTEQNNERIILTDVFHKSMFDEELEKGETKFKLETDNSLIQVCKIIRKTLDATYTIENFSELTDIDGYAKDFSFSVEDNIVHCEIIDNNKYTCWLVENEDSYTEMMYDCLEFGFDYCSYCGNGGCVHCEPHRFI